MTSEKIGDIAMIFLTFRDQLKLYHWTTSSYARHMASDKLVGIMTAQTDLFMETLQGSRNKNLVLTPSSGRITFTNLNDENAHELLVEFKNWLLNGLPTMLESFDNDLYNIRDEILASVNNTIYLFNLL